MNYFLKACAVAQSLLLLAGCGAPVAASPKAELPAQLVIYTSHKEEVYGPIIKEFQERTGIWVQVETAGTNQLLARIAGEPSHCDVMFGGGVESLEAYGDCFQPYVSPEAANIAQALSGEGQIWTPFSALPLVFLYNTKLLTAQTAPAGWEELLQPQWRGKVAFADPNLSGSCYTALATAIQALPQWEPGETVEAFCQAAGDKLLTSSTQVYTEVADGSFMVGVTLEESAIKQMQLGRDVAYFYPVEGTSAVPDGTAIVKGTKHLEEARRFVDFTISKDVQQLLTSRMSRRSVRTDIGPAPGLLPVEELPLIDYDVAWAAGRKGSLLEQWNSLRSAQRAREERS